MTDKEPFVITYTLEESKTTYDEWEPMTHDVVCKYHRIDGPALIFPRLSVEHYFIDGVGYDKSEYWNIINKYKRLPKSVKQTHKIWWVRDL